MVDIFFKCGSCGKHIVVDDSAAGAQVTCPDCHDLVPIPMIVVPRMCPHCGHELKFAGDMAGQHVHCSACQTEVVLSSALPRSHRPSSSAKVDVGTVKGNSGGNPAGFITADPFARSRREKKAADGQGTKKPSQNGVSRYEYDSVSVEKLRSEIVSEAVAKPTKSRGSENYFGVAIVVILLFSLLGGIFFGVYSCSEQGQREQEREAVIRNERRTEERRAAEPVTSAAHKAGVVTKDEGSGVVYVNRDIWRLLTLDQKKGLVSAYGAKYGSAIFKDDHSGVELGSGSATIVRIQPID